jgi:uncharacterized protein YjbJ (UPF0337 family)
LPAEDFDDAAVGLAPTAAAGIRLRRPRGIGRTMALGMAQQPCTPQPLKEGLNMNTDQVKGALKDAAGKVQEKTGELINSPEQQAKGIAKQVEGTTQKNYGDVKENVKDASK